MYQFYMDDMLLPVTPGAMTLKVANQNKTVTLINEGEINILKLPGLSKISFNALLPNRQYPFAQYSGGFQDAQYYLSKLETLKTSCQPFQFFIVFFVCALSSLFPAIIVAFGDPHCPLASYTP